jgi:hypothetical protein
VTTITGAVVTDNVSVAGGGFVANGISMYGAGTKTLRNSIIAGGAPVNCFRTVAAFSSEGGNLEDANTCNFTGPGGLVNTEGANRLTFGAP